MRAAGRNHNHQRPERTRERPGKGTVGSVALLLSLLLVVLLPGAAGADGDHVRSFGPDGTEASDFGWIRDIGLDQQDGFVYVLDGDIADPDRLYKFGPGGVPVDFTGTSPYIDGNGIEGIENAQSFGGVAVDSSTGVFYVTESESIRAFQSDGEPAEFTAGPWAGSSQITGFSTASGVAVDVNGYIYASDRSAGTVSVFAPSGAPLTQVSVSVPSDLAVASNGDVYVVSNEKSVSILRPDVFPVAEATSYGEVGTLTQANDTAIVGLGIDPGNDDVYVLEALASVINGSAWVLRYDAAGSLLETIGKPGTASESSFAYFSQGIAVWGEGRQLALGETVKLYVGETTPENSKVTAVGKKIVIGPPDIEATSVLDVTADSAKLRAWVDPNTAATTYRFEYGPQDCATSSCASVPLGGGGAGQGEEPVEVSHSIFGLQPGSTYHYRVLATNSFGSTVGPSRTFTTQPLGTGFDLIDSRVWEMVSPPLKYGAQVKRTRNALTRAASDGEGLAYEVFGAIEPGVAANRAPEPSTVLAQRGAAGWRSEDIMSPNHEVIPATQGVGGEYRFFSPDLSRAVIQPKGSTPLSPQATERTPYLRLHGQPPVFTPLLTGKDGFANVPPGTEFGGTTVEPPIQPYVVTPDLTHVGLRSALSEPLVAGFPVSTDNPLYHPLYLWTAGQLRPVSWLPADEGGTSAVQAAFGSGETSEQNAISADGSRVFWTGNAGFQPRGLYLRDTVTEETTRLDVPQAPASGDGVGSSRFQGASADGTIVFFTDTRQLTADSSPAGRDLYRCEIPPGSPATGCASLTNLSAPAAGSGDVVGKAALSEDGARIYFAARGVLDEDANQYGDSAQAGEPNLYLWEEGKGPQFIATLDEEDVATWGRLNYSIERDVMAAAAVSPSGHQLAFMSQRSLSGYVNADATDGRPVQEVYRYDAVADDLDCLSCNPFGAAPEGEPIGGADFLDPVDQYLGLRVAAALPATTGYWSMPYRPRTAFDNGRVFFNAIDSLVPADSNDEWDVYQWEPTGVGGCVPSSGDAATSRSAGGCVSLLSSGTAEQPAVYIDASTTGDDAFFVTSARLSPIDQDRELDIYDARVNGVPAVLPSRAECQGEACQPAAAVPSDPTPGTATFRGAGDASSAKPKRCRKGKRKVRRNGRVRCVARKHPRNRKAGQNRRATR